ncbi:murein biosynthesis integral membrane protein MurJ [Patescibacteria group bacterium]|nr:MAG: murein biosynthesis integral membrane protein MurJ [Patescibacteria group bacterium]
MIGKLLSRETTSITGAALLLGAASLASRILGVLRERLLVGRFGVGPELDAYYAAFQVPNMVYNLLVLGTLSVAFIPVFTALWQKREQDAWRFADGVLTATALVMGVLALGVACFAPPLTDAFLPGFAPATRVMTAELTRILALSVFLFSLSNVFGSVLNARKRFLAVAAAPVVYNAAIIAGLLAGKDVRGVAWFVVAGAALHLCVQAAAAVMTGWRVRPSFTFSGAAFRDFLKLFVPRIWGVDISQVSVFVGTAIGSMLASGSVALFNLATNIAVVPVAVFGYPFAIAAFPTLTESLASKNREAFVRAFGAAGRQIVFFLLPIGFLTIVLRAHIIRLIIGTRELSWSDTRLAAAALALFALTLFLQGLAPLFSRAFYAMKNTWIPVLVSGAAVAVNLTLAWGFPGFLAADGPVVDALVRLLRLEDIADLRMLALPLAFSAAAAVHVTALAVVLRLRFGSFGGRRLALSAVKVLAASLLAAVAAYGGLQAAEIFAQTRTYLGLLAQFLVAAGLGGAVYMLAALAFKTEEAELFLSAAHKRVMRITRPLGVGEGERL